MTKHWWEKSFPGDSVSKESTSNSGDQLQCRRPEFDSWVGKILWRKEWQLTLVFLPGKFHGQRRLAGYSPWNPRVGHDLSTKPPPSPLVARLL